MAKYSSDSDSERSSSKYRRKKTSRRSSSLDSTDSSSSYSRRQKYSKSRRRRRSRSKSRDRSGKSYSSKHSRGSSRDRRKRHRSRSSSEDRNRSSKRSDSREKSSTSRSSSSQSNIKVLPSDKPSSSRENFLTNDSRIKSSVLDDINNDEFVPKTFVSSAKKKEPKMKNIVIDMNADTITVPQIANAPDVSNSIFHTSIMTDKEIKFDKWVKKLYSLRQKALNELNHT